jgi:hypothetical protein
MTILSAWRVVVSPPGVLLQNEILFCHGYYSDILGSLFMFCTVFAPYSLRLQHVGTKIYNTWANKSTKQINPWF